MNASPQLFAILSGFIEERVGLHYGPAEQEVFLDKVQMRALEAGFDSLLDYYYYLRYDDPDGSELERLTEALVVHETYFFRELEPLAVAVEDVIGPRVAAGQRAAHLVGRVRDRRGAAHGGHAAGRARLARSGRCWSQPTSAAEPSSGPGAASSRSAPCATGRPTAWPAAGCARESGP